MTLDQPLLAALLQGLGERPLAREELQPMCDVFMRICNALGVSDPADPMVRRIARTVITLACAGEHDPDALYARAVEKLKALS